MQKTDYFFIITHIIQVKMSAAVAVATVATAVAPADVHTRATKSLSLLESLPIDLLVRVLMRKQNEDGDNITSVKTLLAHRCLSKHIKTMIDFFVKDIFYVRLRGSSDHEVILDQRTLHLVPTFFPKLKFTKPITLRPEDAPYFSNVDEVEIVSGGVSKHDYHFFGDIRALTLVKAPYHQEEDFAPFATHLVNLTLRDCFEPIEVGLLRNLVKIHIEGFCSSMNAFNWDFNCLARLPALKTLAIKDWCNQPLGVNPRERFSLDFTALTNIENLWIFSRMVIDLVIPDNVVELALSRTGVFVALKSNPETSKLRRVFLYTYSSIVPRYTTISPKAMIYRNSYEPDYSACKIVMDEFMREGKPYHDWVAELVASGWLQSDEVAAVDAAN
jgi:hypothetical protein